MTELTGTFFYRFKSESIYVFSIIDVFNSIKTMNNGLITYAQQCCRSFFVLFHKQNFPLWLSGHSTDLLIHYPVFMEDVAPYCIYIVLMELE